MSFFPAELWDRIATFLSRPDLATLALVSTSHVILSRWHLYQLLTLRSDLPSVQSTMALLGRDEGLGKRVRQLELVTRGLPQSSQFGGTWLDLQIFENMARLRSILINKCPCQTIQSYWMFLSSLHKNCSDLQQFRVTAMEWPEVTRDLQEGINVPPFPFLQRVSWTGMAGSHRLSAFSLIRTSCSTVTHLTLGMDDGFESFYQLHLPKLCSLNVGHGIPPTQANRFTAFLVSHPTIRDLILLSQACILSGSAIKVNMLPHLRCLSAHPENLKQLSRHCDSTKYIQSLVCDFTPSSGTVDFHAFVDAAGHFPNLKHCALKTFNIDSAMQLMEALSGRATDLEWWTLASYYRDYVSVSKLRHALVRFPNLKRLDLGEWTEPTQRPTPNQLHTLRELASKNRLLERIDLYMPHSDENRIAFSFRTVASEPRHGHRVAVRLVLAFDYLDGEKEDRKVELGGLDWREERLLEV